MTAFAQTPSAGKPIRVLLADEHPTAREGLCLRLREEGGFEVCGEAGDPTATVQLASTTTPDVIVSEIAWQSGSGFDLLKKLQSKCPAAVTLIWSRYPDSLYAKRVLLAGASGYVEKIHPTGTVVSAIRHVKGGGVFLSPSMTATVLRQASGKGQAFDVDPVTTLSDRELEVFRFIGMCYDVQQIADHLHLSVKTVETYRGRIKDKFGAKTSAELFKLAVRWEFAGALSGDEPSPPPRG